MTITEIYLQNINEQIEDCKKRIIRIRGNLDTNTIEYNNGIRTGETFTNCRKQGLKTRRELEQEIKILRAKKKSLKTKPNQPKYNGEKLLKSLKKIVSDFYYNEIDEQNIVSGLLEHSKELAKILSKIKKSIEL